jgi:hypothetical protein
VAAFVSRYQRALAANAAVLALLGTGVVALLALRLREQPLAAGWRIGLPAAAGLVGIAALAWRLRRRWLSPRRGAAHLDDALRLQQRLITAEEFARAEPPSPLYPLLIEETAERMRTGEAMLPRPAGSPAAVLVALLALLLAWPSENRSPLQRLAMLPTRMSPEPPPPLEPKTPEPPPAPAEPEQRQNRRAPQQQPGGGDAASAPQAGGSDMSSSGQQESADGQGSASPSRPSSDASRSAEGRQGQAGQPSPAREGAPQPQPSSSASANGQPGAPEPAPQPGRQGGREPQPGGDQAERSRDRQEAKAGRGGQPSGRKPQAQGRESATAQGQGEQQKQPSPKAQSSASARAADQTEAKPQAQEGQQPGKDAASSSPSQSGGAGSLASGSQEAMRAEIRQLLQQVSDELQQLQAQLAHAQGAEAGAGTDPELYEPPMPLPEEPGSPLPMTLRAGDGPSSSSRPAGGTGQPSGELSSDAPAAQPEEAQLSDAPLEEQAVGRHAVPPEYRDVFDRLGAGP